MVFSAWKSSLESQRARSGSLWYYAANGCSRYHRQHRCRSSCLLTLGCVPLHLCTRSRATGVTYRVVDVGTILSVLFSRLFVTQYDVVVFLRECSYFAATQASLRSLIGREWSAGGGRASPPSRRVPVWNASSDWAGGEAQTKHYETHDSTQPVLMLAPCIKMFISRAAARRPATRPAGQAARQAARQASRARRTLIGGVRSDRHDCDGYTFVYK